MDKKVNIKISVQNEDAVKKTETLTAALKKAKEENEKLKKAAKEAADSQAAGSEKVTDSLKDQTRATQQASDAIKKIDASDSFGKVGSSASKLAGALSLLPGGAGDAARTIADLADVGEVGADSFSALSKTLGLSSSGMMALGAAGGIAGAALLALGAGYLLAQEQARAMKVGIDELNKALLSLQGATASASNATFDFLETTGQLSSVQREEAKITVETNKKLAELEARTKAAVAAIDEEINSVWTLGGAEESLKAKKDALINAANAEAYAIKLESATKKANITVTEENEAAKEKHAKATKNAGKAAIESAKATTEETKALQELESVLNSLAGIQKSQIEAVEDMRADELQQIELNRKRDLADAIETSKQLEGTEEALASAKLAINARYDAERLALIEAGEAEAQELYEQALADRLAATTETAEEIKGVWEQMSSEEKALFTADSALNTINSISQVLDVISGEIEETYDYWDKKAENSQKKITRLQDKLENSAGKLSEAEIEAIEEKIAAEEKERSLQRERAKEARQEAMKAFKAGKALQIASIVGNTAAAIVGAMLPTPPGLGVVAGSIAGVAIAANGAAAVARVAAQEPPAFDIGGIVGSTTPDQVNSRLLPGEAVLNRSATERLGNQQINRLNAGGGVQSQTVVVVPTYNHRQFDAFIADNLKQPNSVLGNKLKNKTKPGHRR